MALDYINYIQTEQLLTVKSAIEGIQESIMLELNIRTGQENISKEEKDEYIRSMAIGNKGLSGMPFSGQISDTTCNVAESYQQALKRDYFNALDRILEEKTCIDIVNDKLDLAIRRLPKVQQSIIRLFYWEKKTWAEVLAELKNEKHFMSKHQAQTQRREAIERVQSISKITVEMYEYVMKLVEVE